VSDASHFKNEGVVLLADDNDDDVVIFARAYKAAGIPNLLRVVTGGAQAIEYLKHAQQLADPREYPKPVLLFLDLKMPGVDGYEVIRWVRCESDLRELPIVAVTTFASIGDINKAYECGANSFVLKSPRSDEFVSEMRGVKQHWLTP
jgi:CheY-like chemotaxis protein